MRAARGAAGRDDGTGEAADAAASGAPRTVRAYESIVLHVQQLLDDGALKPGDKLPSERELAEQFRVGRSSVRDAIRILDVRGLVKPRQGGGTVVQGFSPDTLVTELSSVLVRKRALVEELMDVRTIIEPALAARAALSATAEDLEELEKILGRQRDKVTRDQPAVEEDSEFHAAIARAARNGVLLAVVDTLVHLLSETRRQALQGRARSRASLEGHRRVLRAIRRRDAAAASEAMLQHIRSVEAIILKRTSTRPK
jgi:GntR family transcriptional regulator, transcriptional repressor for pyruvate dehydrogenase complex